ncbi:unnamed protein product, partial [Rotaria magnacalcarata]
VILTKITYPSNFAQLNYLLNVDGNMSSKNLPAQMGPIYRIPPYYYLHVLDQNTSVTRLEIGPKKFFKQDNETIVFGPDQMITLAPRHFCVVENPVVKNENGQAQFDKNGQVKLSYGSLDVRLEQDYKEPFPLYPGEVLNQVRRIKLLKIFFNTIC